MVFSFFLNSYLYPPFKAGEGRTKQKKICLEGSCSKNDSCFTTSTETEKQLESSDERYLSLTISNGLEEAVRVLDEYV